MISWSNLFTHLASTKVCSSKYGTGMSEKVGFRLRKLPPPLARASQKADFTQPRAHYFSKPSRPKDPRDALMLCMEHSSGNSHFGHLCSRIIGWLHPSNMTLKGRSELVKQQKEREDANSKTVQWGTKWRPSLFWIKWNLKELTYRARHKGFS